MIRCIWFTAIISCGFILNAQQENDRYIEALITQYTKKPNFKCQIKVVADVIGMDIPDKIIKVEFNENGNPKVKAEGLALLPKKGTINQFNELLTTPLQAIFLSKKGDNLIYKLVSLDAQSDWITADITFNQRTYQIYESTISTRKYGEFHTLNTYKNNIYPSTSVIVFNIKKFKVPLRFIGRQESGYKQSDEDKNGQGKITLFYKYY